MRKINLHSGFMVMGEKVQKTCQTSIEACLFKRGSAPEYGYLATSCRAEFISGNGALISNRASDVCVINSTKGDFIIRNGAGVHHPFRKTVSDSLHYSRYDGGVSVHAEEREVRELSFNELLGELQASSNDNQIFMSVSFEFSGADYEILCPCRYLNFSSKADNEETYIQPISGPVLFENNDRYYLSYVVSYINEHGPINTEVALRVPTNIMAAKRAVSGRATRLLANVFEPFGRLLLVDEFSQVIKLEAREVRFLRYA